MNEKHKHLTKEQISERSYDSMDLATEIVEMFSARRIPLDVGLAAIAVVMATAGHDNNIPKQVLVSKFVNTVDAVYEGMSKSDDLYNH